MSLIRTEPKKAVCWRDALTGTVRSEHARTNERNKAIIARFYQLL